MRLRKCTDVSLKYPEYYEILGNKDEVLADIHRNDMAQLSLSIQSAIVDLSEFELLLQLARGNLTHESTGAD